MLKFKREVDVAKAGGCATTFAKATLDMLGTGSLLDCTWSKLDGKYKELTVTFGQGATLKKENTVTFNNDNMFTTEGTDNNDQQNLTITPVYTSDLKTPTLVISPVPSYDTKCGGPLELSAVEVTETLGRVTTFKWEFD
ncbi:MAG: hypothetical protein V2I33_19950 [Kangiellaceae bacterium]|nr:hypothetical protein [Kangiellaceae bacterium]